MSWSSDTDGVAGSARLAAGHHLYEGPDGLWRCALPGDRFLRLRAPSRVLRQAQRLLHAPLGTSGSTTGPPATQAVDASGLVTFIGGLAERGLLDTAGSQPADLSGRVVALEGDNPVAQFVAERLEPHVKVVRGTVERADVARADLVVSCADWLPDARWQEVDRWCVTAGVPWHRSYVEGTDIVVGPCSVPGRTATYADTRARRLAAARAADELRGLWSYLDTEKDLPPVGWPGDGVVAVVGGLLVADALGLLDGATVTTAGHQVRVDPRLELHRHPVVPLPLSARLSIDVAPPSAAEPAEPEERPVTDLVDERFGLITSVTREPERPGVPRAFVDYTADVAATGEYAPWIADAIAGGAAIDDAQRAFDAAIGEAVERYCGNAVPADLPFGSFEQLTAAGRAPIDPAGLALYSREQYAHAGFPFAEFTRDLGVSWVPGTDLGSGEPVLVPAALTYLNVHRGGLQAEPPIICQAFAGIAAGPSAAAARRSALEELIERDAVTIWWSTGTEAQRIDVSASPVLTEVLADPQLAETVVTFLRIPCGFDLPVVGAFLEDPRRGLVGFGSACRATPDAAATKALTEAVVTSSISRELSDPDGGFWSSVRSGRLRQEPYRPFRADRTYRAGFRADWRDLTVLDLNLQLYLDPDMYGEPLRRLREPRGGDIPLARVPAVAAGEDPATTYLDRLAGHGLRAVAADLTTSDIAPTGLHVARVVVPGLYHNAPAAFPLLGGRRLYGEPVDRGWLPRPPTTGELVRHPLPFA